MRLKLLPTLLMGGLVVFVACWAKSCLTLEGSGTDADEPISEAQELYCRSCRADCAAAAIRVASNKNNNNNNNTDQDETTQAEPRGIISDNDRNDKTAKIRLDCRCQTVFDLRKKSFICKSMGQAEAQLLNLRPQHNINGAATGNNKTTEGTRGRQPLEARAVARSHSSSGWGLEKLTG